MANLGRIPTTHEALFPEPVLLAGGVEPVNDFELVKAKAQDAQQRDKETGLRVWQVSVLDPHQPTGKRELKIKMFAQHQPVPPVGMMQAVEFDQIEVIPYVETNNDKERRPRIAFSLRAGGFRGKTASVKAHAAA